MRVICSTMDGVELEGEVIGGEDFDEAAGTVDLDARFTIRVDDGTCFTVNGWLVDVTVVQARKELVM